MISWISKWLTISLSILLGPGYHSVESDCSTYYVCNGEGQAFRLSCGAGLLFDLRDRTCKPAHEVACGAGFAALSEYRKWYN